MNIHERITRPAAVLALSLGLGASSALAAEMDTAITELGSATQAVAAAPTEGTTPSLGRAFQVDVGMTNHGADLDARGLIHYEQRGKSRLFQLKTVRLDLGRYSILVGGVKVGEIDGGGTSDSVISFASLPRPGQKMLDFDPLGREVQLVKDGRVFLSTRMPTGPLAGAAELPVD